MSKSYQNEKITPKNDTGWHYEAFIDKDKLYKVREFYPEFGETDAIAPTGETLEELIEDLEMMLDDLNEMK